MNHAKPFGISFSSKIYFKLTFENTVSQWNILQNCSGHITQEKTEIVPGRLLLRTDDDLVQQGAVNWILKKKRH